jgi:hypothetical protein
LAQTASAQPDRNAAIATAYATGAYSDATIAAHSSIHLATVLRMVRASMQQCEN